jgi:hypothetical protein
MWLSHLKLTDARQLCVGHAKDDRDNQADEQDSGPGERVRPQVDEAHDKYDDNPDHCYRGKDGQVKSPE